MRLVNVTGDGEVGLAYMHMPHWIAINTALLDELSGEMHEEIARLAATGTPVSTNDAGLDKLHDMVVVWFEKKFPNLPGLRDYLDAVKFLEEKR